MANNPYVNKVQLANGTTLIDLSTDTAIASDVAQGKYFHLPTGERVQGTATGGGGTGAISIVDTTDTAGGTIRTITAVDISDTTAVAGDVAQGKYFYTADGTKTAGTASGSGEIIIEDEPNATGTTAVVTADDVTTLIAKSITQNGTYNASSDSADGYSSVTVNVSGGSPSATQHSIYFEFTDSTNTTIPVYYDDSLIGTMITAYTPSTYGQKTVSLAQLDGVTWYDPSAIPLNTQLVDFTAIVNGYLINGNNGTETSNEAACCTDFTHIDPSMTFTFVGYRWLDLAFYDSTKTFISGATQDDFRDTVDGEYVHGILNPSNIPSNAVYVRLSSTPINPNSSQISLIRTA